MGFKMDYEQDNIAHFLGEFDTPCTHCPYQSQCTFEDMTKCCEVRFVSQIKAERVA